jgi:hypothetical protein
MVSEGQPKPGDGSLNRLLSAESPRSTTRYELSKIGFSNMLDYVKVEGPDAFVDLSTLTRDQAAAIQEVTVEDYKDGRGENARDVRRVKVKLSDKRAALVDIGKHLGMFKELHDHSGRDGGPIKVEGRPMSDIEAVRRVAFALGRALGRHKMKNRLAE